LVSLNESLSSFTSSSSSLDPSASAAGAIATAASASAAAAAGHGGAGNSVPPLQPFPLPFSVQADQVASEFLRLELALDTSCLTPSQRLWLPLLDEVTFKLPLRDPSLPLPNNKNKNNNNDEDATASSSSSSASSASSSAYPPLEGAGDDGYLSADASVSALEKELVSYSSAIGFGGSTFSPGGFGQHFRMKFEVRTVNQTVTFVLRVVTLVF
jgi:hypothetical protein